MLIGFQDFLASSDHASRFDVCIAGGGAAGITLALELARNKMRVLLLEGGDLDFTEESQDLYIGENTGRDYFDLDVGRLRFLGGSTNHWAGFCVPFDDFDFEARADVEASGWPIARADLDPWLDQATDILDLPGRFNPDLAVEGSDNHLRRFETQLSPPVRFGEKYAEELRLSQNICAVLNASVTDVGIDTATGAVNRFEVVHTNDPAKKTEVAAERFILALGGIENARLLLNSNRQIEHGVGNDHDLVGRYFMDHIITDLGFALLSAPMADLFGGTTTDYRFGDGVSFAATRDFQRSAGVLNCEVRIQDLGNREKRAAQYGSSWRSKLKHAICSSDMSLKLIRYFDEGFKQERCMLSHADAVIALPDDESDALIKARSEQAPNYDSRVLLLDDKDRLGMSRVAVDWRLLDIDKATLKQSVLELGRYVAGADVGRIRVADWVLDDDAPIAGMADGERSAHGGHHIGTTRMAASPSQGVVDKDCKVFGTQNLYMAGSSVFATGSHAPPTLTIVQLALRLADHLAMTAQQDAPSVAAIAH